ncbi:MAG TPA: ABC transporter permease subunit [Candidatus Sulfomarinibacteraceae bacterium]|nr:ABC transporter permease subunit [Candidatus Sulfomarinibacteraceae bacterium]
MTVGGQTPFGPLGVMRSWLKPRAGATDRKRRRRSSLVAWLILLVGVVYFLLPLFATLEFSLRPKPTTLAYTNVLADPKFSGSLLYSFTIGIITIVVSLVIIVPTAFWVRLKVPRLRPFVEFVTLMPFIIPAVILVFGIIRVYSRKPFVFTATEFGSDALLVAAYVVLSFPYMYRAVDTGLAAIDVRALTEAAQSLGAGWTRIILQVILPNLRTALLSGAFLTLAIVVGEYTIASFLARNNQFGVYLSLLGQNKAFEPAAVSLISFGLTWIAMIVIALIGRGTRGRVTVVGAR